MVGVLYRNCYSHRGDMVLQAEEVYTLVVPTYAASLVRRQENH